MKKKFLAIIPARGGSKGIPHKNIVPLAGKPLIAYTIETALKSRLLDRVIVSTDDEQIAETAKKFGAEVPFLRPAEASSDTTLAVDVIVHALNWLKENENYEPDAVIYLQPTSPLRTTKHIDEAVELFQNDPDANSLVSVIKSPHNFNPVKLMKMEGKYLIPYLEGQGMVVLDRCNIPEVYARNGPVILITKPKVVTEMRQIYGKKILPYFMDQSSSIDIDEPVDLELAEFYLRKRA